MKIGILGCGYVGKAAALYWKNEGHDISVTTRKPDRVQELKNVCDHVYCLESQTLNQFIQNQDILIICVAPDHHSDYQSTYLQTAINVSEQIRHSPQLKQIIYLSSTSVYEDHQGNWVDEETLLVPTLEKTKILQETERVLLDCQTNELNVCIFRLGEIIGPGREIQNRLARQPRPFKGTGDAYTNLIELDDIISAMDFALKNHLHGIYNLCNDCHIPRRVLYQQICDQYQLEPIEWDPSQVSPHSGNKRVSSEKIKATGFTFSNPHSPL